MDSQSSPSSLKAYLRRNQGLMALKRSVFGRLSGKRGSSRIDVLSTFPIYSPISMGTYKLNSKLTIQSINETVPLLYELAVSVGRRSTPITDIASFPRNAAELASVERLKELLDRHGSDKANHHNYHLFYGAALQRMGPISSLLEIGLGTNNVDVVSNMGKHGRPGASLRAFRDFLPETKLYGADIDARILFKEERIETFFVDQTDAQTFVHLGQKLPGMIDFIIDDGLHSPNANLQTVRFGLQRLNVGGWMVVEDIRLQALPAWQLVAALLPDEFEVFLLEANGIGLFAARRLR